MDQWPANRPEWWNLCPTENTVRAQIFVLISEVISEMSLFQGKNMCSYKVGTRSSALINQVSLCQGCTVTLLYLSPTLFSASSVLWLVVCRMLVFAVIRV